MLRQRTGVKNVVANLLKRLREWGSDGAPDERPLIDAFEIVAKAHDRNRRIAECIGRNALKRRQVHRRSQLLALIKGGATHIRHRAQIRHALQIGATLKSRKPDARQRSLEIDISQTRAILKGFIANGIDGPRCVNGLKRGATTEHVRGNLRHRSGQRNTSQRRAVAKQASHGIVDDDTFGKRDACEGLRPREDACARDKFKGGREIYFRKAAASTYHRVCADFLNTLVEGELFECVGILQRATKVLDGTRNTELLNLDELGEIPPADFFECIGQDQLLDILSSSSP